MLFARINNVDYEIIDGTLNFELDAVSEFSVTIRLRDINYTTLLYQPIDILYRGESLISGFIDKRPTITLNNSNAVVVNLNCVNELGRLAGTRSKRNRHYQNTTLSAALADLMLAATGWVLDTTTLTTGAEPVTLDLRTKETLLSQLSELILSVPDTHFRYGGMSGTNYVLEVGDFNTVNTYAEQGFNIIALSLEPQENRFYQVVAGYGGVSDTTVIRLNRAATDVRYLASPYLAQFPISNIVADNEWVVTNSLAPLGVTNSVRKSFSLIKTKNDVVPTAAELDDVSYMLYLKCVRFLKESEPADLYNIKITNGFIPEVGDRIRIISSIQENFYNETLGLTTEPITIMEVNDDYRMTRISLNLQQIFQSLTTNNANVEEFVLDITASQNDELGFFDPDLELYEKLEQRIQTTF